MSFSFQDIILRLVQRASDQIQDVAPDENNKPTSIRLKPKTRQFIAAQAKALNTSINSVIETILDEVAESTMSPLTAQLRSMRERFFFLFREHGFGAPQIVSFMKPHGITASTLSSGEKLSDALVLPALRYLSQTFAVEMPWLTGTSEEAPIRRMSWYKAVGPACGELLRQRKADLAPVVMFITQEGANLAEAKEHGDNVSPVPVGIVVKQTRQADGFRFETYELWSFEHWNYEYCRRDLKCISMFCEKHGILTYGYALRADALQRLINREVMPSTALRDARPSWNPEDYATDNPNIAKEVDEFPSVREYYERHFSTDTK